MADSVGIVVAVKGNGDGKRRLERALTPEMRAQLVVTMLEHVLRAAAAAVGIDRVNVVTREAALVPSGYGVIDDPNLGLNPAIAYAASALRNAGRRSMLVLPADLPFLTEADVQALVESASDDSIVLAPDISGVGTNALVIPLSSAMQPSFGRGSFACHMACARAAGLSAHIVNRSGVSCDIDEPTDLELLIRDSSASYSFIAHALREAS